MANKRSTIFPTRLFIFLCFTGILMWLFSTSAIDVEVEIDSNKNKTKEVIEDQDKEAELAQHYLVFNNDFISHRAFKHEDLNETFIKTKEDWFILDINVGYGDHEYFLHRDDYHHKYSKYLSIKSDGNNLMDYTLQPLTELLGEDK